MIRMLCWLVLIAGGLPAAVGSERASEASPAEAEAAGPSTVLVLPPGEGNPRNSEGDFIRLADGRLLFIYTRFSGGSSDHDAASLVSRVSHDGGQTWSQEDRPVLDNEGGWNVMSVSLLRLQVGRIAMFYLRKNSATDCRPLLRYSDDEAATWSEPVELIDDDEIGYYVLNNDRVVQLKDGRLVAPVALHHRPDWPQRDGHGQVMCYLSDDAGGTWRRSSSVLKAYADGQADGARVAAQEPGVIELVDGRLMMWVRTGAGQQYRGYSTDRGETWSALEPMGVASPQSPASIERVPGRGELLMVWNDHTDRPVDQRKARTPLSVAISSDEGNTWLPAKNIAAEPNGWYCYTAIEFVDDHVLLGHVAGIQVRGQHLATTHLTRLPIPWCYPSPPEAANESPR